VDRELARRVEALRRPLELAAADNFAGVRKVQGLGHALRAACDGLLLQLAPAGDRARNVDQLTAWRATLGTWEQLGEDRQAIEVARGMRLIALMPRAPRPPVSSRSAAPVLEPAKPASSAVAKAKPAASADAKPKPASNAEPTPKPAAKQPAAPAAPVDPLGAPTHSLPGIGPAFAERLGEKGLVTVEDLLWCLPRRYDDVRDARSLADVARMDEGARATFTATVASARMVFARGRRWAEVRIAAIDVAQPSLLGNGQVTAVVRWFNVWAGIEKRMPAGSVVTLSGVVKKRSGRVEFANPDILAIDVPETADISDKPKKALPTILPRYPEVTGVPASRLRSACQTACERIGAIADDGVPRAIETAAKLPSLRDTLAMLHAPPSDISIDDLAALNHGDSAWQRRLAFGELFALGVAVALRRRERRADAAVPCPRTAGLDDVLAHALPFQLTRAQHRAIGELSADLERAVPMNRLLQGDVGAGKTAVAFAAALHVVRAGRQVAVMAPTELLAEQHAGTWKRWAAAIDEQAKRAGETARPLRIELLTASTPKGVRQSQIALLAAGELDIVIGTHSLIAEAVGFGALGLVVIDEQHRFGVAQRAKLRDKGDGQGAPHLLVMTATPIPRTLALTAYGDLDVSLLDELPPGREPVKTKLLAGKRGEAAAYKLIAERVAAGERAYVVCPKVEGDPESDPELERGGPAPTRGTDWKDATTVAGELAAALPQVRVGLVHGRLDGETRDRVMRAFKAGELDVLVATTVIEVGVDVPAATVMVIHDAERFGLAQLHQLRGRVGRGGGDAHCLLVTHGTISEDGRQRLDAMIQTTDGFAIAEADLALRGPGELLGPRQAGVPRLRFGNLAQHTSLLLEARGHAERLLDDDPDLLRPEHVALRHALSRRLAQSVYGAESG